MRNSLDYRPRAIVADKKYLWFIHQYSWRFREGEINKKKVIRFNKNTGTQDFIFVDGEARSITVDQDYVWVAIPLENKLAKIDKEDLSVVHIDINQAIGISDVAVDQTYVWFTGTGSNSKSISQMRKSDNTIETTDVAEEEVELIHSHDNKYLWVSSNGGLCRVDKLNPKNISRLKYYHSWWTWHEVGDMTGFSYDYLFFNNK